MSVVRHAAVTTEHAPEAIGPYSQAIRSGDFIFCSGQIGIDRATGDLVTGGVESEARQTLKNLTAVLEAAGTGWRNVVKTTIYLTSIDDFNRVNEIYASFVGEPAPARATLGVSALPKGAQIEIDAVARVN